MGLMKVLSQSSKELRDILDRLTALESGDTFVTKDKVYTKDEVYTKGEVYKKDEVYTKDEVYKKDEVIPKSKIIEIVGRNTGSNLTTTAQDMVRRVQIPYKNAGIDVPSHYVVIGVMERFYSSNYTSPWYPIGFKFMDYDSDKYTLPSICLTANDIVLDLYAIDGYQVDYKVILMESEKAKSLW